MRRVLPILILLACARPAAAQDATVLSGHVVDADTGQPLPLVHVFLDGTSHGDVTRDDGTFRLDMVPVGQYELVASFVGFDRYNRVVSLRAGAPMDLEIRLNPRTEWVDEVVVVGERDRVWQARLRRFLRMFMGTSRFAGECSIDNPEVLDFAENPVLESLTATASRPLRIRNEALGYEVTYWLDHFVGGSSLIDWAGKAWFRELTPADDGEARRWEERRLEVYRGSVRHFLASAAADRLLDEDFSAAEVRQAGAMSTGFLPRDFARMDTAMGMYRLLFRGAVRVEYRGASEAAEYGREKPDFEGLDRGRRNSQVSWLTLRGAQAWFDATGRLNDPSSVVKYGYWAWSERMATTLPWDWEPE